MTDTFVRLPGLNFMRDCLLRKFDLYLLFESSHYCEVVFTDLEESCSLTFHKYSPGWLMSAKSKDVDGLVEVESVPENPSLFELIAGVEIEGAPHEWFESWFSKLYQEVSSGYVKRALFESAPPTEFETRLEERLTRRLHEFRPPQQ